MERYRIALDAMGGDHAPDEIVAGAVLALKRYPDIEIQLFGPSERIRALVPEDDALKSRVSICEAPEVIDMEEAPVMAVRKKTNSSLVQAMLAVRDKRADAVVSAGSTGAVLAGGMMRMGRIQGIDRPALGPVLPGVSKPWILIDCGANVDCQPRFLVQFGLMGSVYMEQVMGVKRADVGLVNIGVESEKGNRLTKETYALMQRQNSFHFAGNCEARDVPLSKFDVVVADGFDGNIILKYTEGLLSAMMTMLKQSMMSTTRTKIGAALSKPAFREFKNKLDYNEVGGAPLLGVDGAVVKAHGSSGATAMSNAIRQAREMCVGQVTERIKAGLKSLNLESEGE
ncbi:MAG: phosphate acyltransferase PlsX [Clostridia bacterium]|nr:phosphate acyltransferase PlsX [Clostridia bacterium]